MNPPTEEAFETAIDTALLPAGIALARFGIISSSSKRAVVIISSGKTVTEVYLFVNEAISVIASAGTEEAISSFTTKQSFSILASSLVLAASLFLQTTTFFLIICCCTTGAFVLPGCCFFCI